jgi:hypothetical protein
MKFITHVWNDPFVCLTHVVNSYEFPNSSFACYDIWSAVWNTWPCTHSVTSLCGMSIKSSIELRRLIIVLSLLNWQIELAIHTPEQISCSPTMHNASSDSTQASAFVIARGLSVIEFTCFTQNGYARPQMFTYLSLLWIIEYFKMSRLNRPSSFNCISSGTTCNLYERSLYVYSTLPNAVIKLVVMPAISHYVSVLMGILWGIKFLFNTRNICPLIHDHPQRLIYISLTLMRILPSWFSPVHCSVAQNLSLLLPTCISRVLLSTCSCLSTELAKQSWIRYISCRLFHRFQ